MVQAQVGRNSNRLFGPQSSVPPVTLFIRKGLPVQFGYVWMDLEGFPWIHYPHLSTCSEAVDCAAFGVKLEVFKWLPQPTFKWCQQSLHDLRKMDVMWLQVNRLKTNQTNILNQQRFNCSTHFTALSLNWPAKILRLRFFLDLFLSGLSGIGLEAPGAAWLKLAAIHSKSQQVL